MRRQAGSGIGAFRRVSIERYETLTLQGASWSQAPRRWVHEFMSFGVRQSDKGCTVTSQYGDQSNTAVLALPAAAQRLRCEGRPADLLSAAGR